ncbi:hypothetical protein Agub_g13237 [Astrephomene gubernaculifera]|uniref:Uncharacterized protein n=1 Tax=Astrephomene gubernaculifera TaxID=47775 RepID=A0AAD3E245_9CHLO|nr:hypothetical protein Agub_g13237 [Astrephomene gubernaculifera]
MPGDDKDAGHDEGPVELSQEEYAWLQQQLERAALEAGEDNGGYTDWEDPTGGALTQLLSACEDGSTELVEELLRSFPGDVNTPGPDGDAALNLACLFGHVECVQALLAGGADANIVNPEDKSTALHDAAAGGYLEICEKLLEKADGAIVNKADEDGDTPLHNAARGNHTAVVKLLLARGADRNMQNGCGNKPVDEAEEEEVKELLREA